MSKDFNFNSNKKEINICFKYDFNFFIKYILSKFYLNDFSENDLYLGEIENFSSKKPSDIFKKSTYFNVPNNPKVKIYLKKNKINKEWQYLYFVGKNMFSIECLPELSKDQIESDLGLKSENVLFLEKNGYYEYVFKYKDNIRVKFISSKEDYVPGNYPRKIKAIIFERI